MKIKNIPYLEGNSTRKCFGFMPDGQQVHSHELLTRKGCSCASLIMERP
jgi:hypothetical protein